MQEGWGCVRSRLYRDMTQKMKKGNPFDSRKWVCGLSALESRSLSSLSNKNSINSQLLQGNEERLDRETFNKTRWETLREKLVNVPALRLLLDLCEDIRALFPWWNQHSLKVLRRKLRKGHLPGTRQLTLSASMRWKEHWLKECYEIINCISMLGQDIHFW